MRILIADDEAQVRKSCRAILERLGHEFAEAALLKETVEQARAFRPDVVLLDLNFPDGGALGQIAPLREALPPGGKIVIITAETETDVVVQAIQAGAFHYVTKPFTVKYLSYVLDKVRGASEEVSIASAATFEPEADEIVFGQSAPMRRLQSMVEMLSVNDSMTVLIQGESGAGKEVVAQLIHNLSPRRRSPFIAINCPAIPHQLFESELFGHAQGAFTDAKRSRKGLLEQADGGTIFLDEIGETPLEMQAKLLRFLETRKIRPISGERDITLNVRILAATNRDLLKEIQKGNFRLDLYHRLSVVTLRVPALKERVEDIPVLANHFLLSASRRLKRDVTQISAAVMERMRAYAWPGNVREMRNMIERLVFFAESSRLEHWDVQPGMAGDGFAPHASEPMPAGEAAFEPRPLEEIEREHIERTLRHCNGNKNQTARLLRISRQTLLNKLRRMEQPGEESPLDEAAPEEA